MFLWIIALVLFACLGIVGFYQGALRATFSLIGLLVAAVLAMPLSGIIAAIMRIFGLEHPVILGFISPFVAYLIVLIAFKCTALAVHKKLDTYYKYKASDTVRMLFERMNARVGICMGLCNAFVYMVLICVALYVTGYFTVQAVSSDKDHFVLRVIARLGEDLRSTRMDKAVAKFIPPLEKYYDACDAVALIFRNPLLQNRLSTYPVFLTYSDKPEFKAVAGDAKLQEVWAKGPSLTEFTTQEKISALVEHRELFTNTVTALGGDFKDLKTYLETGKSLKYDDEKILGLWEFRYTFSMSANMKKKPNMTLAERKRLRAFLGGSMRGATMIATIDNKVITKLPNLPGAKGASVGSWQSGTSGTYTITLSDGEKSMDVEAFVDGDRLTFARGPYSLVFEK